MSGGTEVASDTFSTHVHIDLNILIWILLFFSFCSFTHSFRRKFIWFYSLFPFLLFLGPLFSLAFSLSHFFFSQLTDFCIYLFLYHCLSNFNSFFALPNTQYPMRFYFYSQLSNTRHFHRNTDAHNITATGKLACYDEHFEFFALTRLCQLAWMTVSKIGVWRWRRVMVNGVRANRHRRIDFCRFSPKRANLSAKQAFAPPNWGHPSAHFEEKLRQDRIIRWTWEANWKAIAKNRKEKSFQHEAIHVQIHTHICTDNWQSGQVVR